MASAKGVQPSQGIRGQNVQISLAGLVDSKAGHEKLLHACRAMCGKVENKLLHRETVYKLSSKGGPPPRVNYELRVRIGKTSSSEHEKFVQPLSIFCLSDILPFPNNCVKYIRGLAGGGGPAEEMKKKLLRPSLRKMVEVDVGTTCDEMLKAIGFETDYVFIRSGQMFTTGSDNRTTITICEVHKLQRDSSTPKIEVDNSGVHVDDLWLVELTTIADSEVNMNIDGAIKEHLGVASMLAPYVTLNCPDENGANAGQHMRL